MGKRAKPEEIIAKLREAEVRLSQGASTAQVAKILGVTEQTYYRWRKEYGGMGVMTCALWLPRLFRESCF